MVRLCANSLFEEFDTVKHNRLAHCHFHTPVARLGSFIWRVNQEVAFTVGGNRNFFNIKFIGVK